MVTEVRHLKMAELSARSGVPATTIRHYLRLGLLGEPLRTSSRMAYYGLEHLDRLHFIRRRLRSGATLREVGEELANQPSVSPAPADGKLLYSSQRARLVKAATAVFLRSGVEPASLDDIVSRAGVGKSAFYRHFSGKRDVLAACIAAALEWYEAATSKEQPSLDRLMRRAGLFAQRRMRDLIRLFVLLRQAEASRAIVRDEALEALHARLRAPLEADLRAGSVAGDQRLLAEMLLSAAAYTLAYAESSRSGSIAELIRRGWAVVLKAPVHG